MTGQWSLTIVTAFMTAKNSHSEVYMKYTLFQQKTRSINEVLLKYRQRTFVLFLYLIYTSLSEVHLKHTSVELQGSEV